MSSNSVQTRRAQAGFTLVELAIVLVIIGLIVGGVLVGQDLIKSAEIRATISQIEKINAAATTFRDKHGNLPGDLTAARATQFGYAAPTGRSATLGQGNGDGLIQGGATAATFKDFIGEPPTFWSDLSLARLIQENIPALTAMNTTTGTAAANMPPTRMNAAAFFHVYANAGRNFIFVGTPAIAAGVVTTAVGTGISPQQAFTIDSKLDDGIANAGTITEVTNLQGNVGTGTPGTGACVSAAATYNTSVTNTVQDSPLCHLAIRASF